MTNKTKSIDTERSLCIKVYTNTQSFGPALLRRGVLEDGGSVGRRLFLLQQNLLSTLLRIYMYWLSLSALIVPTICVWLYLNLLLLTESTCIDRDFDAMLYMQV